MVDAWPTGVSFRFLLEGLTSKKEDNRLKFQPDAGPPLNRRNSSSRVDKVSGSLIWSTAELDDADEFYTVDLKNGTLPFEARNPITGSRWVMQFITPFVATPISRGRWQVSMELNLLYQTVSDAVMLWDSEEEVLWDSEDEMEWDEA